MSLDVSDLPFSSSFKSIFVCLRLFKLCKNIGLVLLDVVFWFFFQCVMPSPSHIFFCSISWGFSLSQERASLLHPLHCWALFFHSHARPPDTSVPRAHGGLCKSCEYSLLLLPSVNKDTSAGKAELKYCQVLNICPLRSISPCLSRGYVHSCQGC